MQAYFDNKAIYINDLIKQKRKKRRVKQLRVYCFITYTLHTYDGKTNNKAQL